MKVLKDDMPKHEPIRKYRTMKMINRELDEAYYEKEHRNPLTIRTVVVAFLIAVFTVIILIIDYLRH